MKQLIVFLILFIVINTFSFEFLINRSSSTLLTITAVIVFTITLYFLVYQPLKKLLR